MRLAHRQGLRVLATTGRARSSLLPQVPTFQELGMPQLTMVEGTWLLRVERASHDLVLDRFPWSWSWLKLPWMGDPLRVEW